MKKIFGILAYPVHHSLSPLMHNAGFIETNTDALYTRFGIPPEHLSAFIDDNFRKSKKISGLSVSVPHKEKIISLLDSVDETVEKIGAVNTVYWGKNTYTKIGEKKLCGTNTDWIGFQKSLLEKYDPVQKNILVLGAGGATRAILYALEKLGVEKIFLWNRNIEKAKKLEKIFPQIEILEDQEKIFSLRDTIDLVINTTSLGMEGEYEKISPIDAKFWQSSHTAFDIVYTPKNTVFLQDCVSAGGEKISGEKMLLFQGVEQFKIFTGQTSPEEVMQAAIEPLSQNWEVPKISPKEKKNILGTIIDHKKTEIFRSFEFWEQRLVKGEHRFLKKLQEKKNGHPQGEPLLIAEIKPASPSKGKILTSYIDESSLMPTSSVTPKKNSSDSVENIAKMYEKNGVGCISVLTDWKFFGAKKENLQKAKKACDLPLLRKDFIIHASQIFEARYLGADAILLMRSVLSAEEIEKFLQICTELGMDSLVEVHDKEELLDVLKNTSAQIIGVNTRDLKTLQINPENFSVLLKEAKNFLGEENFSSKIWVAESGISSSSDIKKYAQGADAILVGTGILLSEDREAKVRELVRSGFTRKKL